MLSHVHNIALPPNTVEAVLEDGCHSTLIYKHDL